MSLDLYVIASWHMSDILLDKDKYVCRSIAHRVELTLSYSVTNKKYWYKPAAGETRLILPKPLMQAFANKQITCIEYDGLSDDEEREIFQVIHPRAFS